MKIQLSYQIQFETAPLWGAVLNYNRYKYTTSDVYVYNKADINSGPVVDETQQTSMVDSLLNKNI